MNNVILNLRPAFVTLAFFTLLFGGLYPAVVTTIGDMAFKQKAEGSLIKDDSGKVIGSELIGQNFSEDKYFWGRLSATTPAYNAAASSGSNQGSNNPALIESVKARIEALDANGKQVPVDLVTASGSGLDPQISAEAATLQIGRIAKVRKVEPVKIAELIQQYTEDRDLGILGEKRVNVLKLNLALDKLK